LPDIDRQSAALEAVKNLEDAGIDALGAVPGERSFGNDVGFDAPEFERRLKVRISPDEGEGLGIRANAPSIVLIDIDADDQFIDIAHEHEGSGERAGLGIFADADFDLKNLAIDGGFDGTTIDFGFGFDNRGLSAGDVGLGNLEIGAPGSGFE